MQKRGERDHNGATKVGFVGLMGSKKGQGSMETARARADGRKRVERARSFIPCPGCVTARVDGMRMRVEGCVEGARSDVEEDRRH